MTANQERKLPPDTSRNVICVLPGGREVIGFYWRAEKLWYAQDGSKRRRNAIEVIDWREVH